MRILDLENSSASHAYGITGAVPDVRTIDYLPARALLRDTPIKRTRRGYIHTPSVIIERLPRI